MLHPLALHHFISSLGFEIPSSWLNKTYVDDDYWFEGTPCLLWNGWNDGKGHGKFWHNGKGVYVHRHSYTEHRKIELASWSAIDHRCRNRPCWNPLHLEDVTSKENTDRGLGKFCQFKPKDKYRDVERATRELYEEFLRSNGNCNYLPEYEEVRGRYSRF